MSQDATNYMFKAKESIAMSDTTAKIDFERVKLSSRLSLADEFID
jgi:hypothetical protein